jgi:hypothetical protein
MTLQIGYAQRTITPDLARPVFLAGFDRDRRAQAIHDELYARALALACGDRRLVLVALDLIGLGRLSCLEIAASLPGADLVLAASHTHHGPDTLGLWGPDLVTPGVDPLYLDGLRGAVLAAARQALADLHPAGVSAAAARAPGLVKNARDPHILDDDLSIVQFQPRGSPPVTLAVFACHPETLWTGNTHVTADYPHALREAVERSTGGPCLFCAGALGGMMTPDVEEHTFSEAARIGQALARRGLDALAGAAPQAVECFVYARRAFEVPLQSFLLEQAIRAGLVRGALSGAGWIQTETSLLQLGSVWLGFVPGELLPELGLALKMRMRQAGAQIPIVVGLANDELGYILPDADYQYPADPFEPGDHYEETMSIGPTAGSTLYANLCALIEAAER